MKNEEEELGEHICSAAGDAGQLSQSADPSAIARHTPGPWFAHQQTDRAGNSLGWIVNHANGRIGWSSYATMFPNEGERAPHTQGGANAHLIAAAPELLDAANQAVAFLDTIEWTDAYSETNACNLLELFREVIAKAEGR